MIFARKITSRHSGKLQTEIEEMHLPKPVVRSHYGNGFIKQYVREKFPHLRRYRIPASGYSVCLVFLKLFGLHH